MEDQEADVGLVTELLAREYIPCDLTWVNSRQAFESALRGGWGYDLLLVDFLLPDIVGDEALALVRKHYPEVPFIFLSGSLGDEKAVECLRMGATDYVLKSNLGRLAPVVRRALEEARVQAQRRETEAANVRLISLLRATLDSTSEGILVVDLAGKITTYNRKFMSLCGIPEYVMAPMEMDRVLQFLLDQFQDPEAFLAEARLLRTKPDSETAGLLNLKGDRVIEEHARPQRLGNQTVGRVYSFREVTDPERSAHRPQGAAGNGQLLLAAAEAGQVVPWSTADDDLILPEFAAAFLGLTAADLPRSLADLVALIHPEDQDRFLEALERPAKASFTLRLRRGPGDWTQTHWRLDRNPAGGYAGIFQAGPAPASGQDDPEQRNRWQTALTASLAQTLRTPVEGIRDSLAQAQPDPAALAAARGHLATLQSLVAEMASASASESGPAGMLNLNELVEKLRPWAASALGPGIRLIDTPCPGLPALPMNPARMEPVLINLLLNARDALDGSGEVQIRTGIVRANGTPSRLFLEVQDNGPGIPPKVRERMFDPFFSTRPEHRGLGLTVARSIVESYGGTLEVATGAAAGTIIRVLLPSD